MRVIEPSVVFSGSGSGTDNCSWSSGVSGATVRPEETHTHTQGRSLKTASALER